MSWPVRKIAKRKSVVAVVLVWFHPYGSPRHNSLLSAHQRHIFPNRYKTINFFWFWAEQKTPPRTTSCRINLIINLFAFRSRAMNSVLFISVAVAVFLSLSHLSFAAETPCLPTAPDAEGPFYKPNAPIRESTGRGLTVSGKVMSAGSCMIIPGARVEWWQANKQGKYDDEHRGAQLTSSEGRYHFETDSPPSYFFRPPHIHVKISASGYQTLTTQIYPKEGQSTIRFDFVLIKK